MTKAKVYFSDMRTRYGGLSLPRYQGLLSVFYRQQAL